MLGLLRDDSFASHARNGAADVGSEEVMNGPFPPAHAGADSFLLLVLREGGAFLGELGVERSRHVAHWIQSTLIALEEHLLCVLAEELAEAPVHRLLFGSAQVAAEDAIAVLDQSPIYIDMIGRNNGPELWLAAPLSTYSIGKNNPDLPAVDGSAYKEYYSYEYKEFPVTPGLAP